MVGAGKVKLKRLFSDLPPDTLILESSKKRPNQNLHYVREKSDQEHGSGRAASEGNGYTLNANQRRSTQNQQQLQHPSKTSPRKSRIEKPARRIYHLRHADQPANIGRGRNHDLATFQEARDAATTNVQQSGLDSFDPQFQSQHETDTSQPLKRPGKSAGLKRVADPKPKATPTPAEQRQIEELANHMHQAALEELRRNHAAHKNQPPPVPKLSGARSRALHRQRALTNGSLSSRAELDIASEAGDEFVYDTYILAPSSEVGAAHQADAHLGELDNVGYLVISSEDEGLWATYAEDELSDMEAQSDVDEDDENAEDFYGADYPEDELASDDEFDRDAYGFRHRRGSDEEEWDGAYSDEGDDDEYERVMNPFGKKTSLGTPARS